MVKLKVPLGQDGKSLLFCVTQMLPRLRGGDVKKILKNGGIKINGVRTKQDIPVHAGDSLEVYIPEPLKGYPAPDIVYEDENLIVVNKSPGVSVVEDRDDGKPTLQKILAEYMAERDGKNAEPGAPYACHRLDHKTGGLTLFAKSEKYYDLLSKGIAERRISKYYKTIVVGAPLKSSGELKSYLEKDAQAARVRIVSRPTKTALPAVTRYTVLKTNGMLSLLEVELVTGRTHQIRAHMAAMGTPVLGDDKYGDRNANKKYGVRYQALWATKMVFNTGSGNPLSYLNGKVIETDRIGFPDVDL